MRAKILIVTYWFHPQENAATSRINSFVKYLPQFGFDVTVVAYDWQKAAFNSDRFSKRLKYPEVRKSTLYRAEVYKVRRRLNLRDYLLEKKKFTFFRKVVSLWFIFWQYYSLRAADLKELNEYLNNHLQEHNYDLILTSGRPFQLFKVVSRLSDQYRIPWVADYRDGWSTSSRFMKGTKPHELMEKRLAHLFEKKWVRNAAKVITVSPGKLQLLENTLDRRVELIYNGFDEDHFTGAVKRYSKFTIAYTGSTYDRQEFQLFFKGVNKFIIDQQIEPDQFQLVFAGNIENRLKGKLRDFIADRSYLEVKPWLKKRDAIELIRKSHVLFYTGWQGFQGVIPAKIFEYMATGNPVIICPPDYDDLDELVLNSNAGYILRDENGVARTLAELYKEYQSGNFGVERSNQDLIKQYSRKNQVKKLAKILQSV